MRPLRLRYRVAGVLAFALAALCAGCASGGAAGAGGTWVGVSGSVPSPSASALPAQALASPGCSAAAVTGPVLGTLAADSTASAPGSGTAAETAPPRFGSAIEVAVSPDGRFAFVTLEYADQAAVFNLAAALAHGFGPADYVGSIPLGAATVGLAVSRFRGRDEA